MPGSFTRALYSALGNRLASARYLQRFPYLIVLNRLLKAAFLGAFGPNRSARANAGVRDITFVPISHLAHHVRSACGTRGHQAMPAGGRR